MRPSVLKHVRVRDYLRSLVTHELAVGDAIPSERLLCERFAVSRMTVRQAVDALVAEGLLEREQGRGTFVAPPEADPQVRLSSFGEEMARRGMVASSRVIAAEEVAAMPDVADALGLLPGEPVHHLHRIRYADGEPMAIEHSWVPRVLVPGLLEDGPPASVYGELRAAGLDPDRGEDTVAASVIDADGAAMLGVPAGAAVLRLARRTFAGETACVYSRSTYRADRYVLWIPLHAPRQPGALRAGAEHRAARRGSVAGAFAASTDAVAARGVGGAGA